MTFEQWYNYGVVSGFFEDQSNKVADGSYKLCQHIIDKFNNEFTVEQKDSVIDTVLDNSYNWAQTIHLLDGLGCLDPLEYPCDSDVVISAINTYNTTKPSWVVDIELWNDFVVDSIAWKLKNRIWLKKDLNDFLKVACTERYFYSILSNAKISLENNNECYVGDMTLQDYLKGVAVLYKPLTKNDKEQLTQHRAYPEYTRVYKKFWNSFASVATQGGMYEAQRLGLYYVTGRTPLDGLCLSPNEIRSIYTVDDYVPSPVLRGYKRCELNTFDRNEWMDHDLKVKVWDNIKFDYADILVLGKDGDTLVKWSTPDHELMDINKLWEIALDSVHDNNDRITLVPGTYISALMREGGLYSSLAINGRLAAADLEANPDIRMDW